MEYSSRPFYLLFKDDSFMMFRDKSFHAMGKKISIYGSMVKSSGTVEVNRWVCYLFNGERDIDATMIMRQTFGV